MTTLPERCEEMDKVILEIKEQIAIITINRPEKRNAMNQELRAELYETMRKIDSRDDIRVIIITGVGDAFVAGADISTMKEYTRPGMQKRHLSMEANSFCLSKTCESQ
jgi:enoyl-CoA hydratase